MLEIIDVYRYFGGDRRASKEARVHALDGVSLTIAPGETVGVVGESGCGKSTLGRIAAGLLRPSSGEVRTRGRVQTVFQNPAGSLDPRWTIRASIAEPLARNGRAANRAAVAEMLQMVDLPPDVASRLPHELSGGQQQRVCIARALVVKPQLVVLDESLSALDVSLQAQILELLNDLQVRLNVAYLFISHDLAVVRALSHRVAVLYLGKIVELAPAHSFAEAAAHPYAFALQSSSLVADPIAERDRKHIVLQGDVPTPTNPPTGCRFRTRCPFAQPICTQEQPKLRPIGQNHVVACHFPGVASREPWPDEAAEMSAEER